MGMIPRKTGIMKTQPLFLTQDASDLQAMINFASASILALPSLYQQLSKNSEVIVQQQMTVWKSQQ